MKTSTFKRHIREGFKSLYRNGWMTFASISAVTVTLILVGTFLSIIMNVNNMVSKLENDVEIRVHIDVAVITQEGRDEIKAEIKKFEEVDSITFSSKEQELQILKEGFGENSSAFDLIEQENPLNDTFVVKTHTPDQIADTAKKIEKLDNVANVKYGQGEIEKMFNVVKTIRDFGLILIIGLLFTAMFLISNTIKVAIFARRKEIEIMRLVGATNNFIRIPFLLEGFLIGVLGSVIPIGVTLISYQSTYGLIADKLGGTMFTMLPIMPYGIYISVVLVLIGSSIGMWGSVMSVRKFLKK